MTTGKLKCGELAMTRFADAFIRVLQQHVIAEEGRPDAVVVLFDRRTKAGKRAFEAVATPEHVRNLGGDVLAGMFLPTWIACSLIKRHGGQVPTQIVNVAPELRRESARVLCFGKNDPSAGGMDYCLQSFKPPKEGWTGEMPDYSDFLDLEAVRKTVREARLDSPKEAIVRGLAEVGADPVTALTALSQVVYGYCRRVGGSQSGTFDSIDSFAALLHRLLENDQ